MFKNSVNESSVGQDRCSMRMPQRGRVWEKRHRCDITEALKGSDGFAICGPVNPNLSWHNSFSSTIITEPFKSTPRHAAYSRLQGALMKSKDGANAGGEGREVTTHALHSSPWPTSPENLKPEVHMVCIML